MSGILFAPLVHDGFPHLLANTPPLLVLGTAMLYLYPTAAPKVLPAIWLGPGIAVWLLARGGVHIGASGLVYGLVSYIFVAGLIRRDRRAIAASLLVCFMYGALVWGDHADPHAHVVGNASRGGGDRRRARARAAANGYPAAQALHVGGRAGRRRLDRRRALGPRKDRLASPPTESARDPGDRGTIH